LKFGSYDTEGASPPSSTSSVGSSSKLRGEDSEASEELVELFVESGTQESFDGEESARIEMDWEEFGRIERVVQEACRM
jgi:hypothetical protein